MQKIEDKDYLLWKSFKRGDQHAFYRLYDDHVDALYAFGQHFTRDPDLIKDCIHDLFLELHKYRKHLSDTTSIRFYLLRSLRRKIHKEQLKLSPTFHDSKINSLEYMDQTPSFEDLIIKNETESETHRLLHEAMKLLTDRQREALFLRFEQDMSYLEIAELFQISVESVRTAIYRALQILRKIL